MDIQQLDQDLPVVDGTVTLTTASVDGLLNDFLVEDNGAQPLVISNATKTVTDDDVIIDGTTSFLNVAGAPIHAVFTVQADGSVVAVLTISLPAAWKFSTSFPDLPKYGQQSADPVSVLDELILTAPSFVIATAEGTDGSGAPLAPGLNFVGHFDPTGVAGLFSTVLGGNTSFLLYGTIDIPASTTVTPALAAKQYPWEATWSVPGIMLYAPLGIDIAFASLRIDGVFWQTYSPTDTVWLAANPTYAPLLAVTGTLSVPSASITAKAAAIVLLDGGTAIFDCNFEGATIGNLAQLTDLVNGPDLATILPSEIASAISSVGVETASIAFSGSFAAIAVDYVALKVGLPNVTWDILPGVFSVGNIGATFTVTSPFTASRGLVVSLSGGIDVVGITVNIVSQYPGFTTLATGSGNVPFSELFASLVPELPPPPDVNIDVLHLTIVPGQQYSFTLVAGDDPEWTLDLGPFPMTIGTTTVDIGDSGSGMQGSFTGSLEFDDNFETDIRYDTPGDFIIYAEIADIDLSDYIARLDEIGVTLPSGFDITFTDSYILIEEKGGGTDLTFSVGTTVDALGLVAFTAEKSGGQWGYAAGVQVSVGGIASIPGLAPLAVMEDFVGLTELLMLVSSIDDPGFTFPDMAAFNAQPLQGQSMPLPPQANGVVKGVNIYAQLSAAKDQGFQILADYLGIALDGTIGLVISVSAPDPVANSKLFLTVGMDINSATRIDGQMGVLAVGGQFGVFLDAVVKTSIQGQPMIFTVAVVVVPTGILITGTMQGTIEFDPVQLSNVAILIGVDDAGIPSIGFAATIDVADFESSIAVFFDSTDPGKSMFAGAVDDLSLLTVATSIAGQDSVPSPIDDALAQFALKGLQAFTMPASVAPSLDDRDIDAIRAAFAQGGVALPSSFAQIFFVVNTAGSVWHLTDLSTMLHYKLKLQGSDIDVTLQPQIYCAPQTTFIGALKYPQGVNVVAEIDYFLVKAEVKVEINSRTGIAADVSAAPIQLISPNFFTVTGDASNGGPLLSLSTYTQPAETDPMLQPPHFLLSGVMRILGSDLAGIYVSISGSGLVFDFKEEVAPAVTVDLHGSVDSALALAVGGGATVGIDNTFDGGALGKIHVVTTVSCTVDIGADDSGGHASVSGSFEFEGLSLTIPTVALDITTTALANLPDTLWIQIVDIFNKLLLDSEQWLEWVGDGIIEGAAQTAEEVGQVLDSVYHLVGDDIATQTQKILDYDIDHVTEALEGAGYTAEETADILQDVGYETEAIADAIESVFSGGEHVDFSMGHADVPQGPHGDTAHSDVPEGPHVDVPETHGDLPKVHTDTPKVHTDINTGFHTDIKVPHGDDATPHGDTGTPHGDTPLTPHVDTGHSDIPTTPHVDTGTHVDT